ncbi:MAG TPA: carbohydrate kinase family protein [Anaerolineae bacterium]
MRFVTAGGLRIDYLITHDGRVHTGLVGGNALYAAVGAAIWDDNVGLWARVGQNYPRAWLAELRQHGIETDGLVRVDGDQDHRTFYAYTPGGGRDDTNPAVHFARIGQPLPPELRDYVHSTPGQDEPYRYEPLALRPADWPDSYDRIISEGYVAVHLSPLALSTHLHVPAYLRQRAVRQITVDPGERYMVPGRVDFVRQILGQIDAFLPSDQEVYSLLGPKVDLAAAVETLCQWGAPLVVIKNGANGVLVQVGAGGDCIHLPAYHRVGDPRVVDVTGAGDAFCGGFMVGLAQKGDPLQAARMGLVSASLVIEGYGALYALGRKEEASGRLHEMFAIQAKSTTEQEKRLTTTY